jgi:pimeloyl-ACP methyl ester carboxylesterase
MPRDGLIKTRDGRQLCWTEQGDPHGTPLLLLHGTPGSRLSRHPDPDLYSRLQARVITYDRPGYGASDRHVGRSIADVASDVSALVDALELRSFAVVGISGGGPHALACAAILDEVQSAAAVVSPAPIDAEDLDWLAGQAPANVTEASLAMRGEAALRPFLEDEAERMRDDALNLFTEEDALSEGDQQVLSRESMQRVMRETLTEAVRQGIDGWLDDDLAMVKPWGFALSGVPAPVALWFGADDSYVPLSHGEYLARAIPHARVNRLNAGHLSSIVDSMEEVIRDAVRHC